MARPGRLLRDRRPGAGDRRSRARTAHHLPRPRRRRGVRRAFRDRRPRALADVVALREALLASMSPEAFRAILANHASVRERLLRRLTGSVRELTDRLLELGAQPVQRRTWIELLRLARLAGVDDSRRAGRARADAQRHRQPGRHFARAGHARAVAPGARRPARARGPRAAAARRRRARAAGGRRAAGSGSRCRSGVAGATCSHGITSPRRRAPSWSPR